jgi:hypothetical protein
MCEQSSNVFEILWYSVFTRLRCSRKLCAIKTLFLTDRKVYSFWVLLIGLGIESAITIFELLYHVLLLKDDIYVS